MNPRTHRLSIYTHAALRRQLIYFYFYYIYNIYTSSNLLPDSVAYSRVLTASQTPRR